MIQRVAIKISMNPLMRIRYIFLPVLAFLPFVAFSQSQIVSGDLSVTGSVDIDGGTLTQGTQGGSYGAGFFYTDSAVDTLRFHLNRYSASWLWTHDSAGGPVDVLRLRADHTLLIYKADGTTVGVSFAPGSKAISLGGATLYEDGAGVLKTDGALKVGGGFSAASYTALDGEITGGATGLVLSSGGLNQSIFINPDGSGNTVFSNGNVGIGTSAPVAKLEVQTEGDEQAVQLATTSEDLNNGGVYSVKYSIGFGAGAVDANQDGIPNAALRFSAHIEDANSGSNYWGAYIFSDGNVGIGATGTPKALLDVAGNTHVRGDLSVLGVARVLPAGDIPMTGFTDGPAPSN